MAKPTLIANMGLFWREDCVYWGAGSKAGHLNGVRAGAKTSKPVNFRKQRGIYVLYSDYKIIYIGQAGTGNASLFGRLKRHTRDDLAERWNRFSWFGLDRVLVKSGRLAAQTKAAYPSTTTILNHIEGILIHATEPPLNRQGGTFGQGVHRYRQCRDDRLGKTATEASKHTNQEIKKIQQQLDEIANRL